MEDQFSPQPYSRQWYAQKPKVLARHIDIAERQVEIGQRKLREAIEGNLRWSEGYDDAVHGDFDYTEDYCKRLKRQSQHIERRAKRLQVYIHELTDLYAYRDGGKTQSQKWRQA